MTAITPNHILKSRSWLNQRLMKVIEIFYPKVKGKYNEQTNIKV